MTYKIPLFDLNYDHSEEDAVIETLRSGWISTGPKTIEFETLFAKKFEINHAVALSNCTVALHLALQASGIGPGDEVICPSLTFVATVNAIKYVSAIPVFADVKSLEDLTIDPEDIERKISARTKAIIVMHYGGYACDMDSIMILAGKYHLKVIEDACHGPLSEYHGKKLGTIGHVGCFSFFSNKNMSTGEGGMLITNDDTIFRKSMLLRSHGMTSLSYDRSRGHSTNYDVVELGYNFRMDDIRASLGIVQLNKLEADIEKRSKLRDYYIEKLTDVRGIIIPFKNRQVKSSNYIFPVIIDKTTNVSRDELRMALADAGIQTSVHYPAVHLFSIYRSVEINLPNTEYATDHLITLPLYSSLGENNVEFIVDHLKNLMHA